MKLKVLIEDSRYINWKYYDGDTFKEKNLEENFNPATYKLFTEDVFILNNNKVEILHSVIRNYKNIAGVLLMNKTYGRLNNDKVFYKCIPHDKRLPNFLIPVNIKKKNNISFEKNNLNKYITFSFKEWVDKHPIGVLQQTIGFTNNIHNFFEYQLYSKNLNISITDFTQDASLKLKRESQNELIENIRERYKNIEDRTDEYIFSIDPLSCQDFDDAFSIIKLKEDSYKMSIYISNVAIILDYLDLWNRFSERVSTIYLPDRKRPMLPTILSENLCSLKKSERRFAISLDLFIENNIIIEEKFRNVLIEVKDNLSYKEVNNLQNENYKLLHTVTKDLSKNYKYINDTKDSHDLVSYYMLLMNNKIAEYQEKFKNGIYRSVHMSKEPELPEDLKDEIASFFKIYHSMSGFYSKFENRSKHCYLFDKESSYLHITSPIRRLVDLLNLLKFQENLGEIKLNNNSKIFYENWLSRLDYINITMRSIKKVQNNCNLLFSCTNDSSLLEKEHLGYIFDKLERNDGLKQYSVYLENLNLISKVIIKEDLQNYKEFKFKLFVFLGENEIKKKIRLKIIL